MKLYEFLQDCRQKNIRFKLNGDELKISAPPNTLNDQVVSRIKSLKPEIMSWLKEERSSGEALGSSTLCIPLSNRQKNIAVSFNQEQMWLSEAVDDVGSAYHFCRTLHLEGTLNKQALDQAFSEIVSRHEALRTTFYEESGEIYQKPNLVALGEIPLEDLSALNIDEAERKAAVITKDFEAVKFDLSNDLMMRCKLVKLNNEYHQLVIALHHIASDGWSLGVLVKELCEFYKGFVSGVEANVESIDRQYVDYASWQRTQVEEGEFDKAIEFWEKSMADAPEVHSLPTDFSRPLIRSFKGETLSTRINKDNLNGLKSLAHQSGSTLFMVVQTLLGVALTKYGQSNDIVIGTPAANRSHESLANSIGYFVNMLPLRNTYNLDESFINALKSVSMNTREAFDHQQVPFDQIVKKCVGQRSPSYNPLVQVALAFQNNEIPNIQLPELSCDISSLNKTTTLFDLQLEVTEDSEGLSLLWEYSAELFKPYFIEGLSLHFNQLAHAIMQNPEKPISSLNYLKANEDQELCYKWNKEETDFPKNKSINALFEYQVSQTPDSIATEFNDATLSYRELNTKANQLAEYLCEYSGVEAGDRVGICMDRSSDMVVSILAILKAGAAYVPLDREYPQERLDYMVHDAGLKTVITHKAVVDNASIQKSIALCLDDNDTKAYLSKCDNKNISAGKSTGSAYVIYTSGSTGKPKGVAVGHSAVVRLVKNTNYVELNSESVIAQASNMSFDAMTFELWGALLNGGKLVYVDKDTLINPSQLGLTLLNKKINTLFITTALFNAIANENPTALSSLKYLLFGGEDCSKKAIKTIVHKGKPEKLLHVYGPTENTTFSLWKELTADYVDTAHKIALGNVIANTAAYVLDANKQLAPKGVIGELYLSGAGVAEGYLNREDITQENFIANPFYVEGSTCSGPIMYKTGDLVRRLNNGDLEFIGRVDHQVKIRGFRIETGEIEHALTAIASVREAFVMVDTQKNGTKELVAYISPNRDDEYLIKQIIEQTSAAVDWSNTIETELLKRLPDYMVPSAIMVLPTLPITPNGKIDRKSLPKPSYTQCKGDIILPVTEQEVALCNSCQAILNIKNIGMKDNFFQLGGHSLLVMRLLSKLQEKGYGLEARDVFSSRDFSDLAAKMYPLEDDTANNSKNVSLNIPKGVSEITPEMIGLVDLTEGEIKLLTESFEGEIRNIQSIYPLSALQDGILFHHMMNEGIDPYILTAQFTLPNKSLATSFVEGLQYVMSRHDALRTNIVWKGLSCPVQVVSRAMTLPVSWLDFNSDLELNDKFERLSGAECEPMDLEKNPLMNVFIGSSASTDECRILLKFHHIILDHVGLDIIKNEISAYMENSVSTLEKPEQYGDFIASTHRQSANNEAEEFFTSSLSDVTEVTAPYDLVDVKGDGLNIVESSSTLDNELNQRIREMAKQLNVGAGTIFHAAWTMVVSACSRQNDIVFGSVFSGRMQGIANVEKMLGVFINTLPFRINLQGINAETLVLNTQHNLRALIPYEQVPLAVAQRCSGIEAGQPLFSAILNYRHTNTESDLESKTGFKLVETSERSNYPFNLCVDDKGKSFTLTSQVDTSIKPDAILSYMKTALDELITLLENNSDQPIAEISILPKEEQNLLLNHWGLGPVNKQSHTLIHKAFEHQVKNRPGAIALTFGEHSITYDELNKKSNKLAHYLIDIGSVKHNTLVGVCLSRSIDMFVSILAILKAGGAYLPIDPEYPSARLEFIVEDSGINTVLTSTEHNHKLSLNLEKNRLVVLDQDSISQKIDRYPSDNTHNTANSGRSLAYAIYTSGSTGKPKATLLEHEGLCNLACSQQLSLNITQQSRILQFASIAFDAATWEWVMALANGASLVLISEEQQKTPDHLNELVMQQGITHATLPPVLLPLLTIEKWKSVTTLVVAGESCREDIAALWREGRDFINAYGPSETTVCATMGAYRKGNQKLHIGKPIHNMSAYVLNDALGLSPTGVAGELYIGGQGVGREYLNRQKLTEEKFIANPFVKSTHSHNNRLYRTGDLVRWLDNGDLEFIGRIDHQIKIRGLRVELGEIENTLIEQPNVENAIVIDKNDGHGNTMLVAYVACGAIEQEKLEPTSKPYQTEVNRLLKALNQTLPHYMVPADIVLLDHLPVTVNGKVDRKALPAFDHSQSKGLFVAPQGELQTKLVTIWSDILNVDNISMTDNFFQLGGHSLLAARVIAKINAEFSIHLPLTALFEQKTVADLSHLIEEKCQSCEDQTILPYSRDRELLASFAQQRLWLLDQIDGGSAHYNMPSVLKLTGDLDVQGVSYAFKAIVKRHESLRTTFYTNNDGDVCQSINDSYTSDVNIIDLSSPSTFSSASESSAQAGNQLVSQEQQWKKIAKEEAAKPFDLTSDTLIRTTIVKLNRTEHILLVTAHHIAFDGWSSSILMQEFAEYYEAYVAGRDIQLEPLAIQYADYSQWQHQQLEGERLEHEIDHWQKALEGLPVVHNVPLDKPRPTSQSFNGKTYKSVIKQSQLDKLKALCQTTDTTLFMGVHAALSVLLSRYSNENDIVIGSPTANREQHDITGLIGFFVNNLVLRNTLHDEDTFKAVLNKSKTSLMQAYKHQQVPFEKIVERLQPERSLSHSPLFQIMLVLQNNEEANLSLSGVEMEHLEEEGTISKYDLTLHVAESDGVLSLDWEYNTDLFYSSTIEKMAASFERLLLSVIANPDQNIKAINILSDKERHQQLVEWNAITAPKNEYKTIQGYFEKQVALNPREIAVSFEGESLTYKALNARANQWAHYLIRERDITPGDLVGLSLNRSLDMVVGILAILKSGAAYVPLDPDYPVERLAYMLQDSGVKTVLTSSEVLKKTPISKSQALCIDDKSVIPFVALQPKSNIAFSDVKINSENLAYIIYTSGSTGMPKGVMVSHRNLIASTQARRNYYTTPLNSFLLLSPCSFDSSIAGIFWSLTSGAKLVIPHKKAITDVNLLLDTLKTQNVNYLLAVPSFYQEILRQIKSSDLSHYSLEGVILAGEALPPTLAEEHKALLGETCTLFNEYGPTEATVWSSVFEVSSPKAINSIPIGKSPNFGHLYVMNNGQLGPIGTPGELLIGGQGVSQGYLNRKDLTQEKFIDNPFYNESDPAASQYLYRSGDLVRWLPDGNLDFLGRLDHQIKIRGFRIELGEIENALLACENTKEAIVLAKNNIDGTKYLVAYVVTDTAFISDAMRKAYSDDIQAELRKSLPEYMLPAMICPLDSFPLTPNGKIDRKSLPKLDFKHAQSEYVPPKSTLEVEVCQLWESVLGLEKVGMKDQFFDIGGHSLSATRLMAKINAKYQLALPLNTLFSHQSVSSLVQKIEGASTAALAPAITRVNRNQPLALSNAQQRLWMLDQLEGGSAHYNMPSVMRLSGDINLNAFTNAFRTIIERHESLRTRFITDEDGNAIQVIGELKDFDVPVIDVSHLHTMEKETKISTLIMEEAGQLFSLERDLMIRVKLIKESDNDSILLMTLHHIAADGWSISVLMNEFNTLYNAYLNHSDNPLEDLSIQYADYAQWQREWLSGDVLDVKLAYWKTQLRDLPLTHHLPLDYPRPEIQTYAGDTCTTRLDTNTRDLLAEQCNEQGATLFMGLHTAFAILLARYSDEKDIVIGSPIANREQEDIEHLIGFFVNNLVLRSDLSNNPSFKALLRKNKTMLIDAYDNQQVSFEQIVESLQPERSLSHSPLFQIMLVFQNNDKGDLQLPGLKVSPVNQNVPISKYDLTLHINEDQQGLELSWEFNTDLFKRESIASLAESFNQLVRLILNRPDENVFTLPVLNNEQALKPLHEWNDTDSEYPHNKCIHQMFEQHVDNTPNAEALIFDDKSISYAELNRQSNQLARYLIENKSVKKESLVGICLDRSIDMVVAMLAIQKAGGAYVPIDSHYPQARIDYIVEDAELNCVITHNKNVEKLPLEADQLVVVDDVFIVDEVKNKATHNLTEKEIGLTSDNLAYVIYTSGSTGKPKASLLEHKGLCNLSACQRNTLSITPNSRILQFASVSFDAATWEVVMALGNGAALVLMDESRAKIPDEISKVVLETKVTHATLPPVLLPALNIDDWKSVKTLIVAGDACAEALANKWSVGRHFVNAYGPSEATVCSTMGRYDPSENTRFHMGKPLQNIQTYVLNEALQLAPMGTPGELLVGGVSLARGYLNRPEMTEERFITNPFFVEGKPSHSRYLYRTGDRVRWLPDGNLEFLGRMDNQVKIRGLRIELGEIETSLMKINTVVDATVVVKDDAHGDKQILAYVVNDSSDITNRESGEIGEGSESTNSVEIKHKQIDTIRRLLAAELPDYMLPSHIILLDEMPVTTNGKVDKQSLPEPDANLVKALYVAPKNETESFVCALFEELLSVERVGVTDNFFHLGGHSLMATKLITRINDQFNINLSLQKIFKSHTVEQLVENIEECRLISSIQSTPSAKIPTDEMELTL